MQHFSCENPILEAAENCEQLFTQCYDASSKVDLNQDRQRDDDRPHLIANQQGRFRLWSEYIGVYAGRKASLDYRLRDSPEVTRLVLDQLSILHFHLENIRILLGGQSKTQATSKTKTSESVVSDTSSDTESENESSASSWDEPVDIRIVRQSITRLNRLSLTIRRLSVVQRNSRATYYEEEDENGVGRVWAFHAMAQHMVTTWYPNASEIIQHRLAETMVTRRRQLLYRQSHQQKLKGQGRQQSGPKRNQFAPQTFAGITHSPSSNSRNPNMPPKSMKPVLNSKAESRDTLSTTQASTMYASKFRPDAPSSRASTALSAAVNDFGCFELPKPPKPVQGHFDFSCPYCCLVVPLKEAEEKNWKYSSTFLLYFMNP